MTELLDGSTPVTDTTAGAVSVRRAGVADAAAVQALLLELADHENTGQAVHASTD